MISGNVITFTNYSTATFTEPTLCNGIELSPGGSATSTDTTITNNQIYNSIASGIYIDNGIDGMNITGNTIVNPGSSVTTALTAPDTAAIKVSNVSTTAGMQNATVESNTFIDNRTTAVMAEGIWEETDNLGNCVYGNNQLQITSGATVPEFVSGSAHQGPAWLYASQPGPSVVTPAQATPSPVTGTTTGLSVSGTDPAGASSLTYTWSVTSAQPARQRRPSASTAPMQRRTRRRHSTRPAPTPSWSPLPIQAD